MCLETEVATAQTKAQGWVERGGGGSYVARGP